MRPMQLTILIPLSVLAISVPGPGRLQAAPQPSEHPASSAAADYVAGVDHPYFPLPPGTVFRFVERQGKQVSEIETLVLAESRLILGVACVAVRERVREKGKLTQETVTWYAQDRAGSVWIFGEDSREFLRGDRVDREGSWEAGIDRAEPGVVMPATPAPGMPAYRHGYARGVAEDRAQVVSVSDSVIVPLGAFAGCVQTKEWSMLESGTDRKWYARGVGLVRARAATKEVTVLVSMGPP